jgi:hypothetical protein
MPAASTTALDRSQHRRVTAIFAASDVSFLLPKTATLAELAERLAAIAEPHGGLGTAVMVRLTG